jgi:hypothetical protein
MVNDVVWMQYLSSFEVISAFRAWRLLLQLDMGIISSYKTTLFPLQSGIIQPLRLQQLFALSHHQGIRLPHPHPLAQDKLRKP